VAIDVNSGRSTGQSDVEETAFDTNREAAEVIATQLRLRDLGGLIVIDFIDMSDKRHKQVVEKSFRDATRFDKAKIEIGRISKFGLLEMSRQRLKSSLASHSQMICPHCHGRGRVKTPETAALEALRKIQTVVFSGGVNEVRVRMAPAAALLLLNNKRKLLAALENETHTNILIYADGRMRPEEYELEVVAAKRDHAESVFSPVHQERLPSLPPREAVLPSPAAVVVEEEAAAPEGEDDNRSSRQNYDSNRSRRHGRQGRNRRRNQRPRRPYSREQEQPQDARQSNSEEGSAAAADDHEETPGTNDTVITPVE
jgi:ribonuclease E